MKSMLKMTAAALLLAGAPVVAQTLAPPVIVIVDLDEIVNTSAAGKTAATELQGRIQALQNRANTLQTQLQTEAQAIQAGQANKTLAGAALETRARAFGERQQAAQQELGRGDQEIQRARQFIIKQINDAAQPIITQVMRERGASIALAQGATLQNSGSLDVTSDIIARLNTSLPRVSTTPPPATPPAPPTTAPRQ
ncbi:OmpH family outer membrane protein [Sandaracinobacteroides saxicola]|uniref:OmpH family outer membrane protein n=1 Tax=Sandaracinobacteroides saxicola TaxID=2759707 RepID=A0A7G5IKW5_9SPHN|nr:OmpH family outer membrane protein [Sandaracinobacteroides saxicola]QMW24007.1 OmpH family outer membrane protein [Sandaracinobacteroides saxicola]